MEMLSILLNWDQNCFMENNDSIIPLNLKIIIQYIVPSIPVTATVFDIFFLEDNRM